MTTPRRPIVRLLVSLTTAALTVSCASTATAGGKPPPTVSWQPCAENAKISCASISMPVDWDRPDTGLFDLAVARRPAADPAARAGTLVYLPAGPGSSGVDAVTNDQIFAALFPARIRERFDIVGFDPRGVRRSHPVQCDSKLVAALDAPTPANQREFTALLDAQARVGADCRERTGELFDHLDSNDTARDVDGLRHALDEERLNLYALSYGTVVGQMYAERFPHRIRTMVLDGVFDHSVDSAEFAVTGARAAQQSFDQFVDWCDGEPSCALHGTDIRATVADLFRRAENGNLPGVDPSGLTQRLVAPLTQPNLPAVADDIAQLAGTAPGKPAGAGDPPAELTPLPIFIQCADNENETASFADAERLRARSRKVAPDVRETAFGIASLCVNPPRPATNPQRPLHADEAPPIMVMNSRFDASTPHAGARRVADQLDRSVLVTYEGMGHGAAPRSDCTKDLLYRYLTDRELPASDTRCPATP